MVSLISFLVVIGVCVIIHELGHFAVARRFNILVHEFSFGMGNALYSKKRGDTTWSFRLFPIGGFVKLAGMGETDDDGCPPNKLFSSKSPLQRAAVLAAGSFNNIVLAWFLMAFLLTAHGFLDISTATVGEIIPGYPAQEIGLQKGDVITEVNGEKITTWQSMSEAIKASKSDMDFKVKRGEELLSLKAKLKADEDGSPLLGVRPAFRRMGIFEAASKSMGYTWAMGTEILRGIYLLVTGAQQGEITGPVGIASMAGEVARRGWWDFIAFLAIINLQLGLLNLLPLPALDGGRLLFLSFEAVTRRKVPEKIENAVHYVGLALFIVLTIFVTWKDITKILNR